MTEIHYMKRVGIRRARKDSSAFQILDFKVYLIQLTSE